MSEKYGLYVGNLDLSVSADELRQCFQVYGEIINAQINPSTETNRFSYGFIDFVRKEDRDRALGANGHSLRGRAVKVGISKGTNTGGSRVDARATAADTPRPTGSVEASRRLRDIQHKQYFDKVQTIAREYQEKMERRARKERTRRSRSRSPSETRDRPRRREDKL